MAGLVRRLESRLSHPNQSGTCKHQMYDAAVIHSLHYSIGLASWLAIEAAFTIKWELWQRKWIPIKRNVTFQTYFCDTFCDNFCDTFCDKLYDTYGHKRIKMTITNSVRMDKFVDFLHPLWTIVTHLWSTFFIKGFMIWSQSLKISPYSSLFFAGRVPFYQNWINSLFHQLNSITIIA